MQDPNADTEWNAALRAKGILPPKEPEISEDQVVQMIEDSVQQRLDKSNQLDVMTLDELDEVEDEEDDRVIQEYRRKRMAEMKALSDKSNFGSVREISAVDYVAEVNNAGDDIWVVLHLYKQGIPLCTLINDFLTRLSAKFPATKFLKSISTTCIPNFPDKNLPTLFLYRSGEMKKQLIGAHMFGGMNLTVEGLEWMLAETGAVETDFEEDPRSKVRSVLSMQSGRARDDSESTTDEDY